MLTAEAVKQARNSVTRVRELAGHGSCPCVEARFYAREARAARATVWSLGLRLRIHDAAHVVSWHRAGTHLFEELMRSMERGTQ